MSDPKLISPMLDGFDMGDPISDHNGVRCCPAIRKDTEERYIVKIISTPASQVQVDALLLSGAYSDKEAVLEYFRSLAEDVVSEAQILSKLEKLEGFFAFEACQTEPMAEDTGFDIYLLSLYRRSLQQYLRHNAPTQLDALNLGLDMCAALTVCRQSGYLYVDLKPGNIYLTPDKGFRIGDLGFVSLSSLKYASLPERCRSQYTAPEIRDAYAALNTTIDIYALGLILYQVFNDGLLPFKDDTAPAETFAPPAWADYEMAEIILKACAPDPADRWQDPAQMGQALVSYMQRNGAHDVPITPVAETEQPLSSDEEEHEGAYEATEESASEKNETDGNEAETALEQTDMTDVEDAQPQQDSESEETPEITEQEASEGSAQPDKLPDTVQEAEAEEPIEESAIFTEDKDGNLTFLMDDDDDETAPADADVDYDEVSDEVSDMLQQADELIAHPTPDPIVQPEPIEVQIPPLPETEQPPTEENTDGTTDASPEQHTEEAADPEEDKAESQQPSEDTAAADDANQETEVQEEKPRRSAWPWIRTILLIILAAALITAGILFYKNYYLQPIESIILDESVEGQLTVHVTSQISEDKLTVVCVDTYGNRLMEELKDGKAVFTGLAPNSAYTVKVEIEGFHRLTGDTTAAFTTPTLTEIVQLTCVTGSEDGSIIVSFTIDGPDSEQWRIAYTDDSGSFQESVFAGHTVTLTGFTVGTEYTFTLTPDEELTITGQTQAVYTASKIVQAKDLVITGRSNGSLTAKWSAPDGVQVDSWTVRCYNENGFDETTVVTDCQAAFTIPDNTGDYTVEVTAEGMSVSERAFAPANSLEVKGLTAEYTQGALSVTWESVDAASHSWTVKCSIDGSPATQYDCQGQTMLLISPAIPGSTYRLELDTQDSDSVLGGLLVYQIPDAQQFSGYGVTADKMDFSMCKRPSYNGWSRYDISSTDYRNSFSQGENAGFVIHVRSEYDTSSDEITSLFVIRNEEGHVVSCETSTETWTRMWYRNYCELDIPSLPGAPGQYSMTIYFNGQFVKTVEFTIDQ